MPAVEPLPPDHFAFAVFGDGPYDVFEMPRFRRVLRDIEDADVEWLLHVGDLLWGNCADAVFASRLESFHWLSRAVIYTPGDNEWADCHEDGMRPLERLAHIRATFFARPEQSLGGKPMALESQSRDPAFAEFVENTRWRRGGFLFVTLHLVGSGNASDGFRGRGADDDAEVARRTAAGLAWLDDAFRSARAEGLRGVVLALHANPGMDVNRKGFEGFLDRVKQHVQSFHGPVLLIHGDTHTQRVDHPLRDERGRPLENFTRLETYGSPDIGWVRVVIDSVRAQIIAYEPRLIPLWLLW